MKRKYNLDIGDRSAENIKIAIGYAVDPPSDVRTAARGRDLATGLPNAINVSAKEISDALAEPINLIIEAVRSTLEKTPPELASDLIELGMTLTGGGALLKNMDKAISEATNMPVHVADDPLTCVARGTGRALEEIRLLKKLAIS
jgi:rod shape-determining protein MreB